jgi:hypothetical protein
LLVLEEKKIIFDGKRNKVEGEIVKEEGGGNKKKVIVKGENDYR